MQYLLWFKQITKDDAQRVGGKNYALAQMIQSLTKAGVRIPDGFAVTTTAYDAFITEYALVPVLTRLVSQVTPDTDPDQIQEMSKEISSVFNEYALNESIIEEIKHAYTQLSASVGIEDVPVAVRSSATAEDLPHASFAGQHETFLYVRGWQSVVDAYRRCLASLFTGRALLYRAVQGIDHMRVLMSVGVQRMIRSDTGVSGVAFGLDVETGFEQIVMITASYGVGEAVVQGTVNPDEYHVFKPTLRQGYAPIIRMYCGAKEKKLMLSNQTLELVSVSEKDRARFALGEEDILELARTVDLIEEYFSEGSGKFTPMDVEWALDGIDKKLYIVQARPETVHTQKKKETIPYYRLDVESVPQQILTGLAISSKIITGTVRIIDEPKGVAIGPDEIVVTSMTNPDWVPILRHAAGLITDHGGRTSHAAIVCRELGIAGLIGTVTATTELTEGQTVTVDCSQGSIGYVYEDSVPFTVEQIALKEDEGELTIGETQLMLNCGDPDHAYRLSKFAVAGVGLARIEFILSQMIGVHPLAFFSFETLNAQLKNEIRKRIVPFDDPRETYIRLLSEGIGMVVAAFYPRPVLVRLSDLKSNEYRNLIAGDIFEPEEENPMLGFRGAVRYTHQDYAAAFGMEVEALVRVWNVMGLKNMRVMVPMVRSVKELERTGEILRRAGLERGVDGFELYMMVEVPANALLLEKYAPLCDGFSIGSNDLTQFLLALDRDSTRMAPYFDERDPAVMKLMQQIIRDSKNLEKTISICGEAPSTYPELLNELAKTGIDVISLNPEGLVSFIQARAKNAK